MPITLRQLEYFIATGETGSIKLASERVNISQPAISTAISQLERELGTALFLRQHAHGLTLTVIGRTLLVEAKRILGEIDDLQLIARDLNEQVRGRLAVGCFVTLAPLLMPEIARSFLTRYPATKIETHEHNQEDLLNRLTRAEIDVAITYDLQLPPGIAFEPLAALPPHALVAADHPLSRRPELSLYELAGEPMVLLDLPFSRDYFVSLFTEHTLQPIIAARTPYPDQLRSLVANGFGYALANVRPRSRFSLDGRALTRLPLVESCRAMHIGLATTNRIARPRRVQAFAAHCRALVHDSYLPGMDLGGMPPPVNDPRDTVIRVDRLKQKIAG